ncbi:HSPB1 associated protein 1 [Musca autumnalis]|uniref:HSPB1 associated protein 1 n=1 Tax=Musca autumnalis TaxID=221902 RepID=UPI003CEB01B6
MEQFDNPLQLRELILNTKTPIVLKKFGHKWTCFKDGLKNWCENFDMNSTDIPQFETIALDETDEPQWERKRQMKKMSTLEFLNEYSKECKDWCGLNYKRKSDFPAECSKGVDFGCFGFPQATDDCTFWLSSKGANTPCHYDTYGCNIVVQIFGRKSWLLFSPNNSVLTPTRIPYEESSVYCKENLYAPNTKEIWELKKLSGQCYYCILEPNDVLIVPRHWWHYVESLEISLSVNAWIPLYYDLDNQIEECITKYIMETSVSNTSDETKIFIMNPNQLSTIASSDELFQILEFLLEQKLSGDNHINDAKKGKSSHQYQYLEESEMTAFKQTFSNVYEVPIMSHDEWQKYLKSQSHRRNAKTTKINEDDSIPLAPIQEALLNSLCSPRIVEAIKNELLNRFKEKNKICD